MRDTFNTEFYNTLNPAEKNVLNRLATFLPNVNTEKEIQELLYELINDPSLSKKENLAEQQRYFNIFYQMLFSRNDGPRLYLFFAVADKAKYLKLLTPSNTPRESLPDGLEN